MFIVYAEMHILALLSVCMDKANRFFEDTFTGCFLKKKSRAGRSSSRKTQCLKIIFLRTLLT